MAEKIKNNIFSKIPPSKSIEDTVRLLERDDIIHIGEISGLGKIVLAEKIKEMIGKKIIFLTSKKEDILGYLRDLDIKDSSYEDIHLQDKGSLFLNIKDIFNKTISPDSYKGKAVDIVIGKKIKLDWLANHLVSIGYERVKKPGDRGEFNIKGDTLVIFSQNKGYKIEFFGDEVEKIAEIRIGNSHGCSLREIKIFPNKIPEGEDYLIKYFDDFIFIIDGEDAFRSHIFSIFQDEDGKISGEGVKKVKEIEDFIKRQKIVYLEDFTVDERKGINIRFLSPKKYHGNTSEFLADLKSELDPNSIQMNPNVGKKIFIVSEKAEHIKKFLTNNGIDLDGKRISFEKLKISEGLKISEIGFTLFSDREIFGEEKKKKKRKVDFSALTNLKKGEYVVHIDHGIGRFAGFGEIVVDSIKREYIFIEYEGGDSIYVPLDQADKITKYISVGNTAPHLSSLKTGHWLKIRKKVAENAEKMAKELIEAQALRVGEKKFYYLDDSREQNILEKTFHYKETQDQKKCIEEVLEDMLRRNPMDRLLCGDVGYGKTEVAIRAATRVVASGGQVAILVPTTILAEQHMQTFRERLDQFGFRIESLSRFRSAKEQKKTIESLALGGVDIVIGTHRLFSKDIKFKNLYLVVIDEEQKFGVKHKEQLKKIRSGCDILTMTATPIPRTLYLGLGGLKDISLINTPPEGRLPIKTVVIKKDDEIIQDAIKKEVERGGQVYFVHNRVETINAVEAKLKKLLPKIRFIVGHGQMSDEKLAHVMNDFAKGDYDVLICSTIIESGLDISTVNTLIVDKATNFGLSQLHQLRGRIGRSHLQAYAYFLFDNEDLKGNAKRRLSAISEKEELGSGYELSLEDLDIRGSGNILGEDQHGSMQVVGVGYYLKLLEEEVEKLKGENDNIHIADIKIDLPLSAFIPDGFYKKEEDKIRSYQTLAGVEDEEELNDFESELKSKYEIIPQELLNLIDIVRLKLKSKKLGINSIIAKDALGMGEKKIKKLYIDFDHVISKEEVGAIFATNRHWYFGNMMTKIDLDYLGKDWLRTIFAILNSLPT